MPEVTLTEEEEKTVFTVRPNPDLAPTVLEKCFGQFSVPSTREGFDDVSFIWQSEKKSTEYLRTWVLERKKTTKVEGLNPGEWFKTHELEWKKKVAEWQAAQKAAKAAGKGKKAEDDDDDDDAKPEVMACKDILDIGEGEPLFLHFDPEDWALMSLRWELATLATAFKKDVDDADRPAIPNDHLAFYYQKYFKKALTPKLFGKETNAELCTVVKDTAKIDADVLSILLEDDTAPEVFVKLVEEVRRSRQRRIDAGDETARLKLSPQVLAMYKAGAGTGAAAKSKGK